MSPSERNRAADYRDDEPVVDAVDAATVVLVRDGDAGLEVLLLERHLDSDFAGGAFVFPGGKVDEADRSLDPARRTDVDLAAWRERLGVADEQEALGLLVAAVRESFEEAGILLARDATGGPVDAARLASPSFLDARRRLASRDERYDWRPWLAAERLMLDLDALALWSWWVTPRGQHKRFDTRFLVAQVPEGQQAASDEVETTSMRWTTPAAALQAAASGEVTVIFPTRVNLRDLGRYGSADELMTAARAGAVDQRRIEPRIVRVDGQVRVQHPDGGDPEFI